MYYEDRLKGAGFSACRWPARAARRDRRRKPTRVRAQPRGAARHARSRRSIRGRPPRLTDRIAASPALLDTLAPLVGPAAARAEGGLIRTNLATRPFYNERLVHAGSRARALLVVALHGLQRRRASSSCSRSGDDARQRRRRRRSARSRAPRGRREAARQRQPAEARPRPRRRAGSQRPDRPADVLVDRPAQPVRDDAARRRADHLRPARRSIARRGNVI